MDSPHCFYSSGDCRFDPCLGHYRWHPAVTIFTIRVLCTHLNDNPHDLGVHLFLQIYSRLTFVTAKIETCNLHCRSATFSVDGKQCTVVGVE